LLLLLLVFLGQQLLVVGLQELLLCARFVPAGYGGALRLQVAAVCGLQSPASRQAAEDEAATCIMRSHTCCLNTLKQTRCSAHNMLLSCCLITYTATLHSSAAATNQQQLLYRGYI
jgi:hypothetical protein